MSHIELGQINRDSIADIWRHNAELKRLRDRAAVPLRTFIRCAGCEYVDYCLGGCPASAHVLSGHDSHPSPDHCLRYFLEQGGCVPDLASGS